MAARFKFAALQSQLDVNRLVFLDESGFRLGASPRFGWAPRGQDAPGKHVQGKWETMTMVGAIALNGFRGFMTVDAGTGIDVFEAFVEYELVPNLRDGALVVMDNLSAHKHGPTIRMIEQHGAQVLFTPPYSPEFNPIEKTWAKLKDIIRRFETLTRDAFDEAVAAAMELITSDDICGWFRHCGYSVSSA